MTTEKPIKMKDGTTLPKGLPVRFDTEAPWRCFVTDPAGNDRKVRVTSAFKAPSIEELMEAADDSTCPSVGGEDVEPDGCDCHGSPSWMLALGVI